MKTISMPYEEALGRKRGGEEVYDMILKLLFEPNSVHIQYPEGVASHPRILLLEALRRNSTEIAQMFTKLRKIEENR